MFYRKWVAFCLALSILSPACWAGDALTPPGTSSGHMQVAAVTTGAGNPISCGGLNTEVVVVTGITTATITMQGTVDPTTSFANPTTLVATNVATGVSGNTITANGTYVVNVAGFSQFQANITSWTSGAITVDCRGTNASSGFSVSSAPVGTNSNVNVAQINGVTTSVGNGATDTGTTRVTLSNDSTGLVKLATGANTIGALTANQSVNTAQVNGTSASYGNTLTDTQVASGAVTTPSAGAAICTLSAPGAGTYKITVYLAFSATAATASDINNLQLQHGSTVVGTLMAVPANAVIQGPYVFERVTAAGGDAITVNAIGVGTTGTRYSATVLVQKVP